MLNFLEPVCIKFRFLACEVLHRFLFSEQNLQAFKLTAIVIIYF